MDDKDKIEELFNIVTELNIRELSSNVILYQEMGWRELCDKAIEYLKELR